jgi:hypothetical protein
MATRRQDFWGWESSTYKAQVQSLRTCLVPRIRLAPGAVAPWILGPPIRTRFAGMEKAHV